MALASGNFVVEFRPMSAVRVGVEIVRNGNRLATFAADVGQHFGEAGEQVYAAAMRTLRGRDVERRLHLVEGAPRIGRGNRARHRVALVAKLIERCRR